jgi:hypothetical protein
LIGLEIHPEEPDRPERPANQTDKPGALREHRRSSAFKKEECIECLFQQGRQSLAGEGQTSTPSACHLLSDGVKLFVIVLILGEGTHE